jgi:hypothetical protein
MAEMARLELLHLRSANYQPTHLTLFLSMSSWSNAIADAHKNIRVAYHRRNTLTLERWRISLFVPIFCIPAYQPPTAIEP